MTIIRLDDKLIFESFYLKDTKSVAEMIIHVGFGVATKERIEMSAKIIEEYLTKLEQKEGYLYSDALYKNIPIIAGSFRLAAEYAWGYYGAGLRPGNEFTIEDNVMIYIFQVAIKSSGRTFILKETKVK